MIHQPLRPDSWSCSKWRVLLALKLVPVVDGVLPPHDPSTPEDVWVFHAHRFILALVRLDVPKDGVVRKVVFPVFMFHDEFLVFDRPEDLHLVKPP